MPRFKTLLPLMAFPLVAAATTATTGCRKGDCPRIQPIMDQEAVVGQNLTFPVVAIDPEGDPIEFRFDAVMVPDINGSASLSPTPDGQALFSFTPVASQLGSWGFDFYASDGKNECVLTILINVRGAVGSGSLPIFRKPLGSGTVLDLDASDSISLDIEVEDPDSSEVSLKMLDPIVDGSDLTADDNGLEGSWFWEPSREQIEASDRWDITFEADDGDNPPTTKDFIIVIRKRKGEDCPGDAPSIDHDASDFSTVQDLKIEARITDDQGLGSEPYLLYALEDPGDPVDFTKMTLVEMKLDDGDMRDGTWSGTIPNPVANESEGTSADIYYLISASDDDDTEGDCDHLTDAPSSGSYNVTVTNAAGDGAGICESCSFDVQCGDDEDLCVVNPAGNYCGQSCDGGCPGGYVCSPAPVDSVDGASAEQCIPNSGSCQGGGGECSPDEFEPNNSSGEASGPLSSGTTNGLTLCSGNEDWYEITVSQEAKVTATLDGESPPDMDLALTTSGGTLIKSSVGLTSEEELTSPSCLDPGTYKLRVYTFDSAAGGDYSLGYSLDTGACGGTGGPGEGDCCEDNNSPGCEDADVQECVCGMDAFCCDTEWDNTCAGIADNSCDADCGGGDSGGGGDCCTVQTGPGCNDSDIQSCVCDDDAFCCSDAWDVVCVGKVGSLLCGPSCNPDDGEGYCCDPDNPTPGCEINSIEMCVCEADSFCCDVGWDQTCVDEIAESMCSTATCPS